MYKQGKCRDSQIKRKILEFGQDLPIEVRQKADWVPSAGGGNGAVREICEAILQAKGVWEKIVEDL